MKLVRDEALVLKPGDFGAKIIGADLHIPTKLYDLLAACEGQLDAVLLFSWISTYPMAIETEFQWSRIQVALAIAALRFLLEGYVHSSVLYPPLQPVRAFGVLPKR